jgi:drug/metabolite transporter (DMT)-like permease
VTQGVSPLAVASVRTGLAALVLFALDARGIVAAVRALSAKSKRRMALAGVLLGLHFATFITGVMKTSLAAAVGLISLEPVAILALAFFVFRARPAMLSLFGVALATSGAVVTGMQAGHGDHTLTGDALVVFSVLVYATYLVVTRGLREEVALLPYASVVFGIASLSVAPFALASGLHDSVGDAPTAHSTALAWGAVVALAVIPTALGHTLIARAARIASPALVALLSPGESLGSIVIGVVALSAIPSGQEALGALAIVIGATATTLSER